MKKNKKMIMKKMKMKNKKMKNQIKIALLDFI